MRQTDALRHWLLRRLLSQVGYCQPQGGCIQGGEGSCLARCAPYAASPTRVRRARAANVSLVRLVRTLSAPRAKRKPASRRTHGAPSIHARSTRTPVNSQYSALVDVARRAARCAPSVAVRPGYLPALACIISAPSHRVEGTARKTSCCFASRATTELMPLDVRQKGSPRGYVY